MTSAFAIDNGGRPVPVRDGGVMGAVIEGTASDSGWYRVCPDGTGAVRSGVQGVTEAQAYVDVYSPGSLTQGIRLTLRMVFSEGAAGNSHRLRPTTKIGPNNPSDSTYSTFSNEINLTWHREHTLRQIVDDLNDQAFWREPFTSGGNAYVRYHGVVSVSLLPGTDDSVVLGTGRTAAQLFGSQQHTGFLVNMHDGVDFVQDTLSPDTFTVSTLRADVASVDFGRGWGVHLVNGDGGSDFLAVEGMSGSMLSVYPDIGLKEKTLRYILVPQLLHPFRVGFKGGGTLELGWTPELLRPGVTGYSRQVVSGDSATVTMKTFEVLDNDDSVEIPVSDIHNIFYKFESASADNRVYWGDFV